MVLFGWLAESGQGGSLATTFLKRSVKKHFAKM